MATKANKTVKVEDSKSVNNAVENFDTPVMDERILKLNELKAVKMANLSKGKRPVAKKAKVEAQFILENWDNLDALKKIDFQSVEMEIALILESRLKNFYDASKAAEKVVKDINYKNVKEIIDSFKLTDKETKVILFLNDQLNCYFGETYSDIDCNDIAEQLEMNIKTVKGVIGSLVKKNICETYDTGTGYDVVIFHNQENMSFHYMKFNDSKPAKAEKAHTKKEAKKADKEEQPKEKEAKTARKVGDVHPNHPTWIWTEYTEGKFDWRTNPADKKQGQRTDKAKTSAKKSEPKKKAAKKETKPVKEEKKELTIDEFVAMPKAAKSNKKPSEAQAKVLKLINKGYRITADKTFFEKDDSREVCNWDSVVALFRRYGIEYIPEGLVKSL